MLDYVDFYPDYLDMTGGEVALRLWPYGEDKIPVLIVAESNQTGKIYALPHPLIGPTEWSFEELLDGLTFLDEDWLSTTVQMVHMQSGTVFGPHLMAKAVFNLLLEGGWIESELPFFAGDDVQAAESAITNKAFASFGMDMSQVLESQYEGRPFEFHMWPVDGEDGLYGYTIRVLSGQCQPWRLQRDERVGQNKVLAFLPGSRQGGSIIKTTFDGDLHEVVRSVQRSHELAEQFSQVTQKIGMVLGPVFGHTMSIRHLEPNGNGPYELMPMVEINGLFALKDASVLLINDGHENLERFHHRYFDDGIE